MVASKSFSSLDRKLSAEQLLLSLVRAIHFANSQAETNQQTIHSIHILLVLQMASINRWNVYQKPKEHQQFAEATVGAAILLLILLWKQTYDFECFLLLCFFLVKLFKMFKFACAFVASFLISLMSTLIEKLLCFA